MSKGGICVRVEFVCGICAGGGVFFGGVYGYIYIYPPAPQKNSDLKLLTFTNQHAIMVVLKINGERRILG